MGQSLDEQQINNVHIMDNKINAGMQRAIIDHFWQDEFIWVIRRAVNNVSSSGDQSQLLYIQRRS